MALKDISVVDVETGFVIVDYAADLESDNFILAEADDEAGVRAWLANYRREHPDDPEETDEPPLLVPVRR